MLEVSQRSPDMVYRLPPQAGKKGWRMICDDIQKLRRLIDVRADFHLSNWGRWRRIPEGPEGFEKNSNIFLCGGISPHDAFEILCEESDFQSAEISDSIIDDLEVAHKIVIQHVYEASVWQMRNIENTFVDAVSVFWRNALEKGLV